MGENIQPFYVNTFISELAKVETEHNNAHESLRNMTGKLCDLEHEPRLEGFMLKPISLAEVKALNKGFGLT